MKPELKGDFSHSIGEVISVLEYEQLVYDVTIHHESKKQEEPGTDPVQVKEESLDTLRESSHG